MILKRMQLTTLGRMPHIASKVVDDQGVNLIHDWIAELKTEPQLSQPRAIHPRLTAP